MWAMINHRDEHSMKTRASTAWMRQKLLFPQRQKPTEPCPRARIGSLTAKALLIRSPVMA